MSYVEAVLVWSAGPSEVAESWLRERGFTLVPMKAGLLVTGSEELFEKSFEVDKAKAGTDPVELPIPDELQAQVKSIGIPRRRRFGG